MATYYIYFMTSTKNTTLYIGVTNDLKRRIMEHQQGRNKGFTKKYNLDKLVYYEEFPAITLAITREKRLKGWRRDWKNKLISSSNPEWDDLYDSLF